MDKILSASLKTGESVQLGEALSAGLKVTAVGLSIVFAVLIILMIVLVLFKVIFYKEVKINNSEDQIENVPAPIPPKIPENKPDNDELIAVITAAIAASLGTEESKFKIKSYKRIPSKKPIWNRAGINDTIDSHIT